MSPSTQPLNFGTNSDARVTLLRTPSQAKVTVFFFTVVCNRRTYNLPRHQSLSPTCSPADPNPQSYGHHQFTPNLYPVDPRISPVPLLIPSLFPTGPLPFLHQTFLHRPITGLPKKGRPTKKGLLWFCLHVKKFACNRRLSINGEPKSNHSPCVCVLCHAKPLFCVEVTPPASGNINNMCGGAIISDFISAKRGRTLTAEDLWTEFDTISDLLGLDHSSSSNNNNKKDQFEHQQNNKRVAQKPKIPLSKGNYRHFPSWSYLKRLCLHFFFFFCFNLEISLLVAELLVFVFYASA